MRLLLTSDLHNDKSKLHWLLNDAPPYDGLFIAGDLLDLFSNADVTVQKSGLLHWRQAVINSGKSVAWCSGNHDFIGAASAITCGASPLWMRETESSATCVTDGETRLLDAGKERIAVTTLPWPIHERQLFVNGESKPFLDIVKRLLHEGKKLQAEQGAPWIILCHEPPGETPLSAGYVAPEADLTRRMIEAAEPDFSVHGHIHEAPIFPGGSWIWQLGKTVCFNAGQSHRGDALHYILLDWRGAGNWTATWHGDGPMQRAVSR